MTESPLVDSGFAVPVFSPVDDPIAYLNKAMAFLTVVASLRVTMQQVHGRQGEGHMARQCTQPKRPRNAAWYKDKAMLAEAQEAGQILDEEQFTEDLDTYDSDCDDLSNAQAVLMANISNYVSDVISEENVQDTHLQAQQDSMILSVIEQMSKQMINHVNNWEKANKEQNNESVTAELERYKERVKTFEQRLNIDLSSREKMIDSQMDDMIKEKLALKEQVDSLEQNLSKQIKEKECLLQTFTVFKSESKEKEDKYMENEIDLEKKIKKLDNILFKAGYQNPFYLRKAQRIKPILYDGIFISDKHDAMCMINDEETLILEEKSRSKILSKDFGKCFTPQQEMDAEQAFWFRISNPTSKPSDASPVKIDLLSDFLRTTPDACTKVDKQCLKIAKKELFLENDRLLQQIMSQDVLLTVMNSMSLLGESMDGKKKESSNLEAELLKSQNAFNDLLKRYSQLEKHCISLEVSIQLNQEIFQKDESCNNQNALEIPEFFEKNDLKAELQDKDTTICKLKDIINSMKEKSKEENVNYDYCEIETKNVELENSVAKLLSKNELLCQERSQDFKLKKIRLIGTLQVVSELMEKL
ncbi:hypothetical protein Tco_0548256 [Tanacetum coccineum]